MFNLFYFIFINFIYLYFFVILDSFYFIFNFAITIRLINCRYKHYEWGTRLRSVPSRAIVVVVMRHYYTLSPVVSFYIYIYISILSLF